MKVWDLHCDTLAELRYAEKRGEPKEFYKNDLMVNIDKMQRGDYLLQCFACFVNLTRREENPLQTCLEEIDIFYRMLDACPELVQVRTPADIEALPASGKMGAMLTIEEGAVCLDDSAVLRDLYRLGVRMMTLTWNHKNGLAAPNVVPGDAAYVWPCAAVTDDGLTPLGVEFIEEMERIRMILDVSHLSDAGIHDVLRYSKRPFAASHSNARSLCGHVRNLTDEMIRQMGERGCLVGLNYCASFLDANPDRTRVRSSITDMARHARYLMDLGGEDILALGSDFDGIEGDLDLTGAQDMPKLAEGLKAAGFTERQIDKIFWKNAAEFFKANL